MIEERTLESWSQFIFPCTLFCTCQSIVQTSISNLGLEQANTQKKGRKHPKNPRNRRADLSTTYVTQPGHKTPSHVLWRRGDQLKRTRKISHLIACAPFAYSWEIETQATALPMQSLSSLCLKIVVIEGSDP